MTGNNVLVAVVLVGVLVAQTPAPPDFSGTWVLDAARSSAVGGGNGRIATATSAWQDRRLVTTVVAPAEPGSRDTVRYTEARYLDGDALVVEITMAGSPNSRKSVYVRKRE